MEINWTTLILEILNFLILVWILKRIFYVPVQQAIAKRKQVVEQLLDHAAKERSNAEELQKKYAVRLDEWEKTKQQKEVALQQQMETNRQQELKNLQAALQKEREKNAAQEQRQMEILWRKAQDKNSKQAANFAAKLLGNFSSPELETKIITLFQQQMGSLPPEKMTAIKNELAKLKGENIEIKSAFPLPDLQKKQLVATLQTSLAMPINLNFSIDKSLLSGIQIIIGAIILQANLRDELQFFTEISTYEPA